MELLILALDRLISNLFPALEGSSKLFGNVDLSLLRLEHRGGKVRSDRTVCAETAGHSLPRREGTAGSKCVNLDSFLCSHYVERTNGSRARRNVSNVTGLTEGSVKGVLHDGHGVKLNDLCGLIKPFLDVTGADELGNRINECHVACPTGRGGCNISTGSLGDIVDDLGIILDVSVSGEVYVLHGHTKLLIDLVVEVLDHGVSEACLVGDGSDVSVFVSPLVLCNKVNLRAINTEVVDKLCKRNVGVGLGVSEDHSEGLSCLGSRLKTGEEGSYENGMGVHHNLYVKFGVPPSFSLFEILAAEATNVFADCFVLEGNKLMGLEVKLGCGIGNKVVHDLSPYINF